MQFLNEIQNYFAKDSEIKLTALEKISELSAHSADVIVFDMCVTNGDCSALETFKNKAAMIAVTAVIHEDIMDRAILLGAGAVLFKPFNADDLRDKILMHRPSMNINVKSSKNLDEKLSNIFIRAGIPPHIKGYQFLREAVKLSVNSPDMINNITKKLYPSVAEKYCTSSSKVERAIRHAIEVAWNRGKIENINGIFGVKIYNKGEKPTNGELIALITDKLLIESI